MPDYLLCKNAYLAGWLGELAANQEWCDSCIQIGANKEFDIGWAVIDVNCKKCLGTGKIQAPICLEGDK